MNTATATSQKVQPIMPRSARDIANRYQKSILFNKPREGLDPTQARGLYGIHWEALRRAQSFLYGPAFQKWNTLEDRVIGALASDTIAPNPGIFGTVLNQIKDHEAFSRLAARDIAKIIENFKQNPRAIHYLLDHYNRNISEYTTSKGEIISLQVDVEKVIARFNQIENDMPSENEMEQALNDVLEGELEKPKLGTAITEGFMSGLGFETGYIVLDFMWKALSATITAFGWAIPLAMDPTNLSGALTIAISITLLMNYSVALRGGLEALLNKRDNEWAHTAFYEGAKTAHNNALEAASNNDYVLNPAVSAALTGCISVALWFNLSARYIYAGPIAYFAGMSMIQILFTTAARGDIYSMSTALIAGGDICRKGICGALRGAIKEQFAFAGAVNSLRADLNAHLLNGIGNITSAQAENIVSRYMPSLGSVINNLPEHIDREEIEDMTRSLFSRFRTKPTPQPIIAKSQAHDKGE